MSKILLVNQASVIKTGYGIIGHELLTRLSQRHEVAELACDIRQSDPRIQDIPWKVYGNAPEPHEESDYEKHPINPFGLWKFDRVVREFRPTHVISIRDNWMDNFIGRSPLKKYYKWLYLVTADAEGQNKDWLYDYTLADYLYTYQDWSKEQLYKESGGRINSKVCIPATNMSKLKIEKEKLKQGAGFSGPVIGTVMRNMGRKRFPEYFKVIRNVINERPDVKFLCHTAYPDKNGWNIPQLLLENGVQNSTYFNYICSNCGQCYPSLYQGKITFCLHCKNRSLTTSSSGRGFTDEHLNIMYNMIDLYVQYSNCEGLGLPILESAAAGTSFLATNYSAMSFLIKDLEGIPIELDAKYREIDSDRWMSVPSIDDCTHKILSFLDLSEEEKSALSQKIYMNAQKYSWDKMVATFEADIHDHNLWSQQKQIRKIPAFHEDLKKMTPSQFVRWCLVNVLQEESKINSWFESKYIEEISTGIRLLPNKMIPIGHQEVYNELVSLRNTLNNSESLL